jgi:hypothetical protein
MSQTKLTNFLNLNEFIKGMLDVGDRGSIHNISEHLR